MNLPDDINLDATACPRWAPAFIEAFSATWQRLPSNATRVLLQAGVRVQLVETIPTTDGEIVWGDSAKDGLLRFSRAKCEGLPPDELQSLIAHELSHAYRRVFLFPDWNSNEQSADAMCCSWGFNMDALRARAKQRQEINV